MVFISRIVSWDFFFGKAKICHQVFDSKSLKVREENLMPTGRVSTHLVPQLGGTWSTCMVILQVYFLLNVKDLPASFLHLPKASLSEGRKE